MHSICFQFSFECCKGARKMWNLISRLLGFCGRGWKPQISSWGCCGYSFRGLIQALVGKGWGGEVCSWIILFGNQWIVESWDRDWGFHLGIQCDWQMVGEEVWSKSSQNWELGVNLSCGDGEKKKRQTWSLIYWRSCPTLKLKQLSENYR